MKKLRWQLVIILLTGLVVGVLLITQKPQAPALQGTLEPVTGGSYTEALIGSFQRLNPILDMYNQPDRDIDRLIYNGLVHFDSQGIPQSDLAASWGVSHDGTIYNVALKPNITWHDGRPLTSDDVVFTYELLKQDSQYIPADIHAFWKDVEIKKLDVLNLQFRLPEPYSPFIDYLAQGILPRHILGTQNLDQIINAGFNLQPVGTGPYRFDHPIVENNQVSGIVLSAFDKYHGGQTYLTQVIFKYYPTADAAYQAYLNNEVQGISQVTPDILPKVLAQKNLSIYTGRQPALAMVLFNLKDEKATFLQDTKVRQALMAGLNRQHLIDQILGSQAILANGPIFPGTWAYYTGQDSIQYDPEAAVKLLKEAGYSLPAEGEKIWKKDDTLLAFTLSHPDQGNYPAIAEAIQKDWASLGVKVDLEAVPYDTLIKDKLEAHSFQAVLVDLNLSRSADPDPYPFWDQEQISGGQNYSQWVNRAVSEYLEQARTTTDIGDRAKLYRNFQIIFNKELPAIPLYYPVYSYAVDQSIQGVRVGPLFDPSERFSTITDWFLSGKRPSGKASNPG